MQIKLPITALVLAGGKATRLDGRDKGLIQVNRLTLIEHTLNRLAQYKCPVLISANRNIDAYKKFNFPVISDDNNEFQGPLAGISQALRQITTEWLLVVPCDTPMLPLDIAEKLYQKTENSDAQIVYSSDDQREQYLHCLIHRSLADGLQRYLKSGQRAVRHWQQQHVVRRVIFQQENAFLNVNTTDDLAIMAKLLD